MASINKRKSYIFSLDINAVSVYDQKLLQQHVTDFYRSLLGTSTDRSISLNDSF
jgi:hypothetical protein